MKKAIGVLVLIISVVYAHAQADFPKDSSMFKTLGWWEIRQKDSLYTSIGHRYMAGSNLLIESIYANDSQRFHLHNEYKCSNLYYTIYIKEYSMYLRRGINSIHETSNDYVSISKCSGNSIYSYVDLHEFSSFNSYIKDFVSNKYYFKSFIHYNKEIIDEDGKKYLVSRRRDVYLKWEINEDFSVVDEYLDLCDGNGWQHTVKFEKIK